jgi:hypothetical protein
LAFAASVELPQVLRDGPGVAVVAVQEHAAQVVATLMCGTFVLTAFGSVALASFSRN